jgi:cell division GTPase FtsZ
MLTTFRESEKYFPSRGVIVISESKFEKRSFTNSSMPLKAAITVIMAAVTKATTTIEIPEMMLMAFLLFFEKM